MPVPEGFAAGLPDSPLALRASYLPEGNRNLVFAFIIPPPGVNIDHLASAAPPAMRPGTTRPGNTRPAGGATGRDTAPPLTAPARLA